MIPSLGHPLPDVHLGLAAEQRRDDRPMFTGSLMEINTLVKRILGNEWNARDEKKVRQWVRESAKLMRDPLRVSFEEVVLNDKDSREVAESLGIAWPTLRGRLATAYEVLSALARSLPKGRFDSLFVSIFEHEFSEEVKTKELTQCLQGRYDRRSTQVVAVKWIPKVERGELDLPMPTKRGKFWVWTREEAEAWRRWFASESGEDDEEIEQAQEATR